MLEYLLHVAVIIGIYAVLNQGMNLLLGYTGVVSVMQAAFYGVGAYVSALVALRLGASFPVALVAGALAAAVIGRLVGYLVARFRGDYLALVTFGLSLIFYDVFNNWLGLTRGPMGLPGIPQPFSLKIVWLVFVCSLVGGSLVLTYLVASSPMGRLLKGIRDDEELAQTLGRDARAAKATVFTLSAALAGVAGATYAHYITYISPGSFTVGESIMILAMVIIGGLESVTGGLIGAALLVVFPEALRFVGLPSDVASSMRQLLFGLLLLLVILYRPRGVVGNYEIS